ncbi:hypothetical protein [Sinomonas atrocyanea]
MDTVQPDLRAVEARRLAGLSATGAGALLILASPLYVLPGPPPTLLDAAGFADFAARTSAAAITTKLTDALYIAGLVVFIAALRRLLKGKHPWTGDVVLASGTLHAALVLVGDVLAGAAALDATASPDPSAVRALTEASLLAFGDIGSITAALFLAAIATGLLASSPGGHWLGWAALALTLLNLAAVPALYLGSDYMETVISGGSRAAGVYSYISSATGLLYSLWLILLGVWILRNKALRSPGGPRKPQPEQARLPQRAPSDDGQLGRGGEIPSERGE